MSCNIDSPPLKRPYYEANSIAKHSQNSALVMEETKLAKNEPSEDIDESLYSRQLYVLGHEAMRKMAKSNVLIAGMGGLGVEIAKNVCLAGVKSVTIQDSKTTAWTDLTSQFYLQQEDIGKNRAEVTCPRLSEVNSYVPVSFNAQSLTTEFLNQFQVVVLTDSSHDEQVQFGEFCHTNKIKLVSASTFGLFGKVFCDFGDGFVVTDTDGEQAVSCMVTDIDQTEQGAVTCLDETFHGFSDGDYVTFSEVQGMIALNGCEPKKIQVLGPYTFSIGDTSGYGEYLGSGVATQVKMPKILNFKPIKQALDDPEFVITDFSKFDRPGLLHIAFQALDEFVKKSGDLPKPRCQVDADALVALFNEINAKSKAKIEDVNEDIIRELAYTARGNLCPLQAFIGSVAAQEVMKACSGRFSPLMQYLYFDALECLPKEKAGLTEQECAPQNSRYDGQIVVFGKEFVRKMRDLRYFLVGAGAIGCEMLKNWAMMGLGSGDHGQVYVTDMDYIERSNLNRQFLFRPHDVQQPKSSTAAKAACVMNPDMKIKPSEDRVGPETEHIFDDNFFESLDGVTNALDNLEARKYIDGRCVYYCKPLLESGTLGTKASVQVVLPHVTESYSSTQDPPEKSIPICTVKNFPNQIEHTLEWARGEFQKEFHDDPGTLSQYITDLEFVERTMKLQGTQPLEIFGTVKHCLDEKPKTFEDCVCLARWMFAKNYTNDIKQLLFNFPPDNTTSSGALFWSGPKRCPKPIEFDSNEELHLDFICAVANLKAFVYGIPNVRDRDLIKAMVDKIHIPKFTPKTGIMIAVTDAELESSSNGTLESEDIDMLRKAIPSPSDLQGFNPCPHEFEKDDDSNFHIDFIVAASNLRARNYSITEADRHKSKLIAGRIIPAIATTTSMVVGLVCLELIKIAQGHKDIESFKNGFINLALPFFAFSDPIAPKKQKYYEQEFTLWDRFEVEGEMTLQDFLSYFQREHNLNIFSIVYDVCYLLSLFTDPTTLKERMELPLSEVVRKVSKKKIPSHVKAFVLKILCDDEEGEDVEVPYVKYNLPK